MMTSRSIVTMSAAHVRRVVGATSTAHVRRVIGATSLMTLTGLTLLAGPLHAQGGRGQGVQSQDTTGAGGAPSLRAVVEAGRRESDLRVVVQRFDADRGALGRRYDIPLSPVVNERMRSFLTGWQRQLQTVDAGRLNAAGRADLTALRGRIAAELDSIAAAERLFAAMQPLVPFARTIQTLQERRRDRLPVDPMQSAQTLSDVTKEVRRLTEAVRGAGGTDAPAEFRGITPQAALAAAGFILTSPDARQAAGGGPGGRGGFGGGTNSTLKATLDSWYEFYTGYDPLFTWWARKPYEELSAALEAYVQAIRREWRAATSP